MGIAFDWTISIGNIGAAIVVMGGWLYAFFQLKSDVRLVKHDMKSIMFRQDIQNESLTQLTALLTKVAVQEERFNSVEHRIETAENDIRELQHGKGYVIQEVSGEYTRQGKVSHK